ncbi:hypothetical protein CRUP_013884 [Coryphaenoides rupestris]|nr:hypothetical protein CRUP_013884 [Coryphaenoides rupestris]
MDVRQYDSLNPLKRINHTGVVVNNVFYVWGGYQVVEGEDTVLPSDEIWECDLDSEEWVIKGDAPSELMGFCGSFLNGSLYIFGGCDPVGHSNQVRLDAMMSVDLTEASYTWRRITDTKGTTPSPRSKHSCWVHKDRLLYFGGYGCKTIQEVRDVSPLSFIMEETSWSAIGATYFRCWGWNNEVVVFDTKTNTWSMPEMQDRVYLDLYSLDLETWTWTYYDLSSSRLPIGRSMHTLTPTSDHTLLLYGGFGANEAGVSASRARSDAWQFDTLKNEWMERVDHPHQDKPRLWHSACPGEGGQVVVFGGSMKCVILMDSSPWKSHCKDVFVFQTQPSSLSRLCEDAMARNQTLLAQQLSWLPHRIVEKLRKRLTYFSNQHPEATA